MSATMPATELKQAAVSSLRGGRVAIQIDERQGGQPRYVMTREPAELMQVPDSVRKSAVFIGHEDKNGSKQFAGTAFFVSRPIVQDKVHAVYCVTAKHVLDEIRKRCGYKVFLRLNMAKGGSEWIETNLEDWREHPADTDVDVAVLPFPLADEHDHFATPLSMALDDVRLEKNGIGIGDEVFLTGLFSQHAGEERNIPILRAGNIAAMPEEKILSKHWVMDAYLVESRSIGGLSGSPVYVHLGTTRMVNGIMKYAATPVFYLMGLMHGHWDARDGRLDASQQDFIRRNESVNMGIAIVVPVAKILEVLDQPSLKQMEESDAEYYREMNSPVMDESFGTQSLTTNEF